MNQVVALALWKSKPVDKSMENYMTALTMDSKLKDLEELKLKCAAQEAELLHLRNPIDFNDMDIDTTQAERPISLSDDMTIEILRTANDMEHLKRVLANNLKNPTLVAIRAILSIQFKSNEDNTDFGKLFSRLLDNALLSDSINIVCKSLSIDLPKNTNTCYQKLILYIFLEKTSFRLAVLSNKLDISNLAVYNESMLSISSIIESLYWLFTQTHYCTLYNIHKECNCNSYSRHSAKIC